MFVFEDVVFDSVVLELDVGVFDSDVFVFEDVSFD